MTRMDWERARRRDKAGPPRPVPRKKRKPPPNYRKRYVEGLLWKQMRPKGGDAPKE